MTAVNNILIIAATVIFLGFLIDLTLGEPPYVLHPVVWMGKVISFIDRKIPRGNERLEKILGVILGVLIIIIFTLSFTLLLVAVRKLTGEIAWIILSAFMFKTTFAIKSMKQHATPIMECLKKGDLEGARKNVAMIVSRDVKNLDKEHIISATIESISENIVDSIFSPLLFFGIAGIPAALAYRAVNTLDAMVGYKNRRYKNVGWFSAKLDDLANWVSARLSVLFIILATALLRKNWYMSAKIAKRNHSKTESPNSGWPMSALAGGLCIKLEKIGYYTLGNGEIPKDTCYIQEALKIMYLVSFLFLVLITLPLYVFVGIHVQYLIENLFYNMISRRWL